MVSTSSTRCVRLATRLSCTRLEQALVCSINHRPRLHRLTWPGGTWRWNIYPVWLPRIRARYRAKLTMEREHVLTLKSRSTSSAYQRCGRTGLGLPIVSGRLGQRHFILLTRADPNYQELQAYFDHADKVLKYAFDSIHHLTAHSHATA